MGNRDDTDKTAMSSIVPFTIAPGNAREALGLPWRWCRDFARRAGVPIWHVGGKSAIPAAQLVAALERAAALQAPLREPTDAERLAALRAKLGIEPPAGERTTARTKDQASLAASPRSRAAFGPSPERR
jgi:hypothetical protein